MISTSTVKTALNIDLVISQDMAREMKKWADAYINKPHWHKTGMRKLNLAAGIASEIARAVTIEMKVDVTGSARAKYLSEQLEPVIEALREQVEYGVAKGGLVIKPYVKNGQLQFDYVQADMFYPVSFNGQRMTACVFSDVQQVGSSFYTRLEFHRMVNGGCEIINAAYKSASREDLGSKVSLKSVEAWADLQDRAFITNITKPLFAYFRNPGANNVDPTSPLGVSAYARAMDLMEEADQQWTDFIWEFKSGKRRLFVDELAFEMDEVTQKRKIPDLALYRTLKSAGTIGKQELFEEWSPTLREVNLLNGLDGILKRIEFNCNLAQGTISDPNAVALTATEIKMSKQRTYATVTDTQKALKNCVDDLLYSMDTWADLAGLAPAGTYNATHTYDDSIIADHDAQFTQDSQMVTMTSMSKLEFRMRTFGESEAEARKMLALVDEEQKKVNENSLINQGA